MIRGFIVLAVVSHASAVFAYRTASDLPALRGSTSPIRWSESVVRVSIAADGARGVGYAGTERAVLRGMGEWSGPACSSFDIAFDGTAATSAPGDGRNTVEWIREEWSARGLPSELVATTDIEYERADDGTWRIVEADILLNSFNYEWHPWAGDVSGRQRAIDAVLAHETGHLAGLAHSCGESYAPDCGVDALSATTMYPLYAGPEQLSLEADDVAGICALYSSGECGCDAEEVCADGSCVALCGGTGRVAL